MSTQIKEAINRGNNLLIVGVLSFTALGVFTEIFHENEWLDRADDMFVVLVAIVALVWYLRRNNRYQYSWFPYGLLAATFVVKVLAFINEFDDPIASGDEFGVLIPLFIMVIISAVILIRTRNEGVLARSGSIPEFDSRQRTHS
jgi:hypothetical protein